LFRRSSTDPSAHHPQAHTASPGASPGIETHRIDSRPAKGAFFYLGAPPNARKNRPWQAGNGVDRRSQGSRPGLWVCRPPGWSQRRRAACLDWCAPMDQGRWRIWCSYSVTSPKVHAPHDCPLNTPSTCCRPLGWVPGQACLGGTLAERRRDHVDSGPGKHAYQGIDAKQVDPTTNDIANPRLSDTK
jgi:hypothetical protein